MSEFETWHEIGQAPDRTRVRKSDISARVRIVDKALEVPKGLTLSGGWGARYPISRGPEVAIQF